MKSALPLMAVAIILACSTPPHVPQYSPSISVADSEIDKDAGAPVPKKVSACPDDMVEIEGDYCPNLYTECLYNVTVDGHKQYNPDGTVMHDMLWSCGEFKYPTVCLSKKENLVHMHFCMDRYEWPNKKNQLPQDWMTWLEAKKVIEAAGKRLCTDKEWTLAAEGPDRKPVPYGDGYHRDKTACNFDNLMPKDINVFAAKHSDDPMSERLRSFLVPSGSMECCVSDYGVHDMAGNIDEFVYNEGGNSACLDKTTGNCYSGLKGGHVWHVRNASRPMTTAHGEGFGWYETGARACKDPRP